MKALWAAGVLLAVGIGTAGSVWLAWPKGEEEGDLGALATATPCDSRITPTLAPGVIPPSPGSNPPETPIPCPQPTSSETTVAPEPAGGSPAAPLTPGPGVTLWRWMNITVLIPDESRITVGPAPIILGDEGRQWRPGVDLVKDDPDSGITSRVVIDAENGKVFSRDVAAQQRAEMDSVVASVEVSPFDPATAPWPYNGDPPAQAAKEISYGMTLPRPDPAAGILVTAYTGSGGGRGDAPPAECHGGSEGLSIWNGKSQAFVWIDANTGALCKDVTYVQSADSAAFERFLAQVQRCGKDVQC